MSVVWSNKETGSWLKHSTRIGVTVAICTACKRLRCLKLRRVKVCYAVYRQKAFIAPTCKKWLDVITITQQVADREFRLILIKVVGGTRPHFTFPPPLTR